MGALALLLSGCLTPVYDPVTCTGTRAMVLAPLDADLSPAATPPTVTPG